MGNPGGLFVARMEAAMQICSGCHAGCCRSFAVPITGADIVRLERTTGQTFWEFGCRWVDSDGLISRGYVPQFRFPDEPGTPFVLCLKHEASATFPGTSRCHFLKESSPTAEHPKGTALCGEYAGRPAACRSFPGKLGDGGQLAILYDVPKKARQEEHPAYELCPRPWTSSDINPVEMVQDLVVARFELQFFQQVADSWNRNPAPFAVLPDFLRMVYANRVIRQSEAGLSSETPSTLPMDAGRQQNQARAA